MFKTFRHLLELIRFSHTVFRAALRDARGRDGVDSRRTRRTAPPMALAGTRRHRRLHGRGPQRRDGRSIASPIAISTP